MWFTLLNRFIRPLSACIVFSVALVFAPGAYSADTHEICTLELTAEHSKDLFGHAELGPVILRYMDILDKYYRRVESDPARSATLFTEPEFRLKFNLLNYYRSFVFPLLKQYLSNDQLLNDKTIETGLKELAHEERDYILNEMQTHNAELIPNLLSLADLKGTVVVVELSREMNQRADLGSIEDIYQMYVGFARRMGWKFEELQTSYSKGSESKAARVSSATFKLNGPGVYQFMMFESGTHRTIREGEAGRTNTNLVKVRVYHEPSALEFNFDIQNDVEFKTARSSGAGGQHVNKTESAVRAIHRPTGLEVNIESQRSQHSNRATSVEILRAKVYERYLQEQLKLKNAARDGAVGYTNEDRYVRTYNDLYNRA